MATGTIVTIVIVAIGYVVQFFIANSNSKKHINKVVNNNRERTTKIFNDLRLEVVKEIAAVSSTMTTETAVIKTKIETLEEKQDKHNGLIEKTYNNESSTKSAHKRLDGMKDDIKDISSGMGRLEATCAKLMALK